MESEIESAQFLTAVAETGDEVQLQVARHEQRSEPDLWKVRRVIDRNITEPGRAATRAATPPDRLRQVHTDQTMLPQMDRPLWVRP